MSEKFGFPVIDCDGHITEPLQVWTEYLDPAYRQAAAEHFCIQNTPDGAIWVVEEFMSPNAQQVALSYGERQAIAGTVTRAGAYFPGISLEEIGAKPLAGRMWGPSDVMNPGGFDGNARLKDLDLLGVDRTVIIPTFFAMVPGVKDPALAAALCRAYNDWVWDYCSADRDRLHPLAMLPVQDMELAKAELDRVVARGFHILGARPNPMAGHRLDEERWFPFWEALQETGFALIFHPFPTGELEGGTRWCAEAGIPELGETLAFTMDNIVTLGSLMFHGVLDRFPRMKLAFLESSCTWVPGILDRLDKRFYLLRRMTGEQPIQTLPSEIFARQCYISFEAAEHAAPALVELYPDNLIWASDYPHHDADPPEPAVRRMQEHHIPLDIEKKVMGANAARLFGIPL